LGIELLISRFDGAKIAQIFIDDASCGSAIVSDTCKSSDVRIGLQVACEILEITPRTLL